MSSLPILTYHRLLPDEPTFATDPKRIAVSRSRFRAHMRLLHRLGYRTLALDRYVRDLRAGQRPAARSFAITFDDGYEEVSTLALPILQEFGYTGTVFAVAQRLGGSNLWDDGRARLLTRAQLKELQAAGLTIGAHTCTHIHLPQADGPGARREIIASKEILEDSLGTPVALFAYPYGETSGSVERFVREAGFEAAFATDRAPRNHAENLFRLRRVVIFPRTNAWGIFWKTRRGYPAYQDWKRP